MFKYYLDNLELQRVKIVVSFVILDVVLVSEYFFINVCVYIYNFYILLKYCNHVLIVEVVLVKVGISCHSICI
jgi:hypothetical protein